jgi:uncharacterized membrane protein YdjX (TVP38/TMEM64 family)
MNSRKIAGLIGVAVFMLFVLFFSLFFVRKFSALMEDPAGVRQSIAAYGSVAYLVYSLLYIFQIFFAPVPGQVLNVASGMLFGAWRGFLLSWAAGATGGFLALVVSRYLGRSVLYWFLEEKAAGFEKEVSRRGLPLIAFLALFPNPIGDGLFYLAGLTGIPLKVLVPMIAFLRVPGILIYVVAGDRIMMSGGRGWIIGSVGFLAAIVLYVVCGKKLEKIFEKFMRRRPNGEKDDSVPNKGL